MDDILSKQIEELAQKQDFDRKKRIEDLRRAKNEPKVQPELQELPEDKPEEPIISAQPENIPSPEPIPEPEKLEPVYDPEVIPPSEPKTESKNDDLERIKAELDKARREYLEMDYKKRGMWDRVKRFFGRGMVKEKGYKNKLEEVSYKMTDKNVPVIDDQDVVYMRALYENKLQDYKNALLEEAKNKEGSKEDLARVLEEVIKETTVNLAHEREQVRFDHTKDKWNGKLREKAVDCFEWYKKQPLKYKIAFGAILAGGATASAMAGATSVAAIFSTAILGRRLALGAIAGMGTQMWLQGKTDLNREKMVKKETEKIIKKGNINLEEYHNEEWLNLDRTKFNSVLKQKIYEVGDRADEIEHKKLRNYFISGTWGTFVGSGAMSYISKELGITQYLVNAGRSVKDFFSGLSFTPSEVEELVDSEMKPQVLPRNEMLTPIKPQENISPFEEQAKEIPPESVTTTQPPAAPVKPKPPISLQEKPKFEMGNDPFKPFVEDTKPSPAPEEKQPLKIKPEEKTPEGTTPPVEEKQPLKIKPEEKAPEDLQPKADPEKGTEITPETSKGKVLVVEKWESGKLGGSVDGEIKKYLIENNNEGNKAAGHQAAVTRKEFQKHIMELKSKGLLPRRFSLDKIQPGALIELSEDGKRIVSFQDGPGGRFTGKIYIDSNGNPNVETPKSGSVGHPDDQFSGKTENSKEQTPSADPSKEHPTKIPHDSKIKENMEIKINLETEPERFVEYFDDNFKQVVQASDRLEEIYKGNTDIANIDVEGLDKEIDAYREIMKKADVSNEVKKLARERALELDKIKAYKLNMGISLTKLYNGMFKALYGFDSSIKDISYLKDINAKEFFDKNNDRNFGKMIKAIAKVKGIGEEYVKPRDSENMREWTRRVFARLLHAKGANVFTIFGSIKTH